MSNGGPMTSPASSRQSAAPGGGDPSAPGAGDPPAVEARASLSAADKLRPALAALRALRQFEDEPTHFAEWIAAHAEASHDDA